ncbi:hypothetical protein C6501_08940 [Candidatus Poribacteria bacterium]|nr:MAG: hypothetical protein C6501_08940 [Candidatus Poribacteria bacterium]
MKRFHLFLLAFILSLGLVFSGTNVALAIGEANIKGGPLKEAEFFQKPPGTVDEDHSGFDTWISKWYGPDGNYTDTGGPGNVIRRDLIGEGTDDKLTQVTLSTLAGLQKTEKMDEIGWENAHGGPREWTVFELDPNNPSNMNRGGPTDNIDIYGILVIDAPKAMTSIMSPAHDNNAQIWINGEKWYYHPDWTGGAKKIDYNVEIKFQKGANVLLYRVSEGGGDAYMNLHFDDATHDAVKIYPDKATNKTEFFQEVAGVLPVEPEGKLTTIWADIKRK